MMHSQQNIKLYKIKTCRCHKTQTECCIQSAIATVQISFLHRLWELIFRCITKVYLWIFQVIFLQLVESISRHIVD